VWFLAQHGRNLGNFAISFSARNGCGCDFSLAQQLPALPTLGCAADPNRRDIYISQGLTTSEHINVNADVEEERISMAYITVGKENPATSILYYENHGSGNPCLDPWISLSGALGKAVPALWMQEIALSSTTAEDSANPAIRQQATTTILRRTCTKFVTHSNCAISRW